MLRNKTKNVLFTLLVLILFFTASEFLCRIWIKPKDTIFEYDNDTIFRLKRNLKNGRFVGSLVQTNSYGYRDSEIPVRKAPNTIRIVMLGDSITFGHGVAAEETYSDNLERRLNKEIKPYRFDVINTGVPGNSPFQEYYDLKRSLLFKPDLVIIQFVLNDVVEPLSLIHI